MLKRLAIAGVSALVLAACADMPTDTAMQDVDLVVAAAPSAKVPVCHVGHKDDDAGLISLLLVNQKVADRHLNNPAHTYEGVSDYDPLAEGATGIGNEDTDGNGIDDGCEIPDPQPVPACIQDVIDQYNVAYDPDWDWAAQAPWVELADNPGFNYVIVSFTRNIQIFANQDVINPTELRCFISSAEIVPIQSHLYPLTALPEIRDYLEAQITP